MSEFAFPTPQPFTNWQSTAPVPLPRFIGANFSSGWDYSVGASAVRMGELSGQPGELLDPDKIREEYKGEPYITFPDRPMSRSEAAIIANRHREEHTRNIEIENGMTGGWRMAGAFGSQMAGAMANPVDLGLMFVPVIGSSVKARALADGATIGGRVAAIGARGLVTEETLAQAGIRSQTGIRALEAGLSSALTEPLVMASREQSGFEYSFDDYLKNVAFSAGFGAGLHLLGATTKRTYEFITGKTRETAALTSMDQAMRSEPVDVGRVIASDPNLVAREVYSSEAPAWHKEAEAEILLQETRLADAQAKLAEMMAEEKAGKEVSFDVKSEAEKAIAEIKKQRKEIEQNVLWNMLLDERAKSDAITGKQTVAIGEVLPTPKGESPVRSIMPWLGDYRVEFENGYVQTVPGALLKKPQEVAAPIPKQELRQRVDSVIRSRVAEQFKAAKERFEANKPEAIKPRVEAEVREALKKLGWSEEVASRYNFKDHAAFVREANIAIQQRVKRIEPIKKVELVAEPKKAEPAKAGEPKPVEKISVDMNGVNEKLKADADRIVALDAELKTIFDSDKPLFMDAMRQAAPCALHNG